MLLALIQIVFNVWVLHARNVLLPISFIMDYVFLLALLLTINCQINAKLVRLGAIHAKQTHHANNVLQITISMSPDV